MKGTHVTTNITGRLAASVLGLGGATAAIVFGSWAAWTAQTTNPNSAVSTGSLSLTTDKPAAAVFTATDVKPGDTGSETVTVENTSSIALDLSLSQTAVTREAGPALQLQIHDGTDCVYPAATGPCVAYGAWDGSTTLANLDQGTLDASGGTRDSRTYTVGWKLDASSVNSDQNTDNTFTLQWDGVPA